MERARFFAALHYLRKVKEAGFSKLDRMKMFLSYRIAFTAAWYANK